MGRLGIFHQLPTQPRAGRIGADARQQADNGLDHARDSGVVAAHFLQILTVGERIEIAILRLAHRAVIGPPAQQVAPRGVRVGRVLERGRPDVAAPARFVGTLRPVEEVADVNLRFLKAIHVRIIVARETQRLERAVPALPLVLARQRKLLEEGIGERIAALPWQAEVVRALRTQQAYSLDVEFVLPGLATRHGVVLENQDAGGCTAQLAEAVCGAKARDAAAHHHQVELPGILRGGNGGLAVAAIAQAMRRLHHRPGVAVGRRDSRPHRHIR